MMYKIVRKDLEIFEVLNLMKISNLNMANSSQGANSTNRTISLIKRKLKYFCMFRIVILVNIYRKERLLLS